MLWGDDFQLKDFKTISKYFLKLVAKYFPHIWPQERYPPVIWAGQGWTF